MTRLILALVALIAIAAPVAASADDRSYVVSNFDRVRVDAPYDVRIEVGGSSSAHATGDPRVLATLDLSVQGNTLVVRKGSNAWGEQGKVDGPAPIVFVTMPAIRGATVLGKGKLAVTGALRSARLDIQISGSGSIDARGIDAEDVIVTVIGDGNASLAGRTLRARLMTNGPGVIAATDLVAGDLMVRLDGPGTTTGYARYTADLTTTGMGKVAVLGNPKCRTLAPAGGPIVCGTPSAP